MSLFDPIPFDLQDPEFLLFLKDWKIRNSYDRLSATADEIAEAAFLEFAYCMLGCDVDNVKYRDVIVPTYLGGKHAGHVDVKRTRVKTARDNLFGSVRDTLLSKAGWFEKVGIEKVHKWTVNYQKRHFEFWFVFDVKTREFSFET